MARIVMWLATTATVVTLLFGYRTSTMGSQVAGAGTSVPSISSSTPQQPASGALGGRDPGAADGSASAAGTGQASGSNRGPATSKNFTGAAAYTRYGPVQVDITVEGGAITGIRMIDYPYSSPRDQEINSRALPVLISQTLASQDANVDMISGATYTSMGYRQSLQSALDQAGL